MITKQVKLNFKILTEGKTVVEMKRSDVAEMNKSMKFRMQAVIREHRRREVNSRRDASHLVLNT